VASIVAIHSFRGGTGKSNLTANLAYCCACQGARVGVIDTDIQSPGIHILFGLGDSSTKYCLNDYLKGECVIKDTVYDVSGKLSLPEGRISVIPSRLNAAAIISMVKEGFDVQKLSTALSDLTKELQLDALLVDTHPGVEEDTLLSIAMCDILVVVLRPDEQDYLGTAVTFEIARRMEVPKTFLVANRVPPELDLEKFSAKLEKTYKVPVIGVLPFSYDLMMAQSRGVYCYASPGDPFSLAVKAVAERMIDLLHSLTDGRKSH
jgi:MinD-like ATPase involved in chromosome partitioning or flagellar assembly